MVTATISVKKAFDTQADLKDRREHCAPAARVLAALDSGLRQQVRIHFNGEFALYTVSEAVRAKRDAAHHARADHRPADGLSGGRVPQPHRLVVTAGGDAFAVGAKRHAVHRGGVAGQRRADGPTAVDTSKAALSHRMHASGEPVSVIGQTLGVSRATVYRVLAEHTEGDS